MGISPPLPPVFQDMTDNSSSQLVVRAKFNFQQTNEDELSFTKGDVIHVTRVEEGGWWEGTHSGRTGWFPSNYVREIKPSGEWLNFSVGGGGAKGCECSRVLSACCQRKILVLDGIFSSAEWTFIRSCTLGCWVKAPSL